MILHIDTTGRDEIILALDNGNKFIATKKINAPRTQAEKLLPAIDKLLSLKKIKLSQLKKIVVASQGGSFTSLRIGIITANALAYALHIPVEAEEKNKTNKKFSEYSLVEPIYDREPNIGISKKPKL